MTGRAGDGSIENRRDRSTDGAEVAIGANHCRHDAGISTLTIASAVN